LDLPEQVRAAAGRLRWIRVRAVSQQQSSRAKREAAETAQQI